MSAWSLAAWAVVLAGVVSLARDTLLLERLTVWREIDRVWSNNPPLSTAGFWRFDRAVVTRPSDDRLVRVLERVLTNRFDPRSVRRYHAIPLHDYLQLRGDEIGNGTFLTITNIRGERTFLTRSEIERQRPVIVIGLDDERELFRLYQRYHPKREHSWEEPQTPIPWMIRPLGPFLYYPNAPDPRLEPATLAHYALQPEGFALSNEDPLGSARNVPAPVAEMLFGSTAGCLTCHRFRGVGARSHHTQATNGRPHGGYALSFEDYERGVMERFLFDQELVAKTIGVSPFAINRASATLLLETIDAETRP